MSAEGAKIEALKALRGRALGRVSSSPKGRVNIFDI